LETSKELVPRMATGIVPDAGVLRGLGQVAGLMSTATGVTALTVMFTVATLLAALLSLAW
jgi:hypothetical protein